eukprot:2232717-Amphidinium_carterae.1
MVTSRLRCPAKDFKLQFQQNFSSLQGKLSKMQENQGHNNSTSLSQKCPRVQKLQTTIASTFPKSDPQNTTDQNLSPFQGPNSCVVFDPL